MNYYQKIGQILVIFISLYLFFFTDGDCKNTEIFYLNKVYNTVKSIDTDDYATKGLGIFYRFDNNIYLYKSTNYIHHAYPELEVGDSISKEKYTEDFNVYRNGVLFFEGKDLNCDCKYCE